MPAALQVLQTRASRLDSQRERVCVGQVGVSPLPADHCLLSESFLGATPYLFVVVLGAALRLVRQRALLAIAEPVDASLDVSVLL